MARDESQHQPDVSVESETSEPITITTSDPAIESSVEHASDWKIHPDSTLSLETTQVREPNPLYVVGVRKVVQEDEESPSGGQGQKAGKSGGKSNQADKKGEEEQAGDKGGQDGGAGAKDESQKQNNGNEGGQKKGDQGEESRGQQGGDRKERKGGHEDAGGEKGKGKAEHGSEGGGKAGNGQKSGRPQQKQPSLMKSLLMTAGIATVCGLVGAFGYSYFAGSSSGKGSSEQGESKGASGSSKSSKSSGGGGASQGTNESREGQSGSGTTKVAMIAAKEIGTLNQQVVDLMVRVDRLGERVDRMVRPDDETPPFVQSLQLEIGEIFHELDKLTTLGDKVRQYDSRLETLQREIKVLRSRLDPADLRKELAEKSEGVSRSPEPSPGASESSSAQGNTLDRGLRLLEKGQYESARGVFERLEHTQPADARVWYFAALAVGLASGDWDDEARELAAARRRLRARRHSSPPARSTPRLPRADRPRARHG